MLQRRHGFAMLILVLSFLIYLVLANKLYNYSTIAMFYGLFVEMNFIRNDSAILDADVLIPVLHVAGVYKKYPVY